MPLPESGWTREAITAALDDIAARDFDWRSGRAFGYVFEARPDVEAVAKEAYTRFLGPNALDPTVFDSARTFETEVVGLVRDHLGGPSEVVGSFTSGGTESIILALKSARDWARVHRPEITAPAMVIPDTAHAAFHKAAHYLGIQVVTVPAGADYRADVAAMRAAITNTTIAIGASAPSYPQGVIDPIEDVAALASERHLWLHVDACMGGLLLPLYAALGEDVPRFDFHISGVSSISVDLHKYGFCPKGASVILYRNPELRSHQLYACASWAGYTMINSTVQSTRSVGPMAAAWAVMHYVGKDGYLEIARIVRDTTRKLARGIAATDGLMLCTEPQSSLIAFTAQDPEKVSIYRLVDAMRKRGWYLHSQPQRGNRPANIHLTVTPKNASQVDPFLADLAACVPACAPVPSPFPPAQLAAVPVPMLLASLETMFGSGDGPLALPEDMAPLEELLAALPPQTTEAILKTFLGKLLTPAR